MPARRSSNAVPCLSADDHHSSLTRSPRRACGGGLFVGPPGPVGLPCLPFGLRGAIGIVGPQMARVRERRDSTAIKMKGGAVRVLAVLSTALVFALSAPAAAAAGERKPNV